MQRVIIVGSTGSIGTQAIDFILKNRDSFLVVGLAASTQTSLLREQAQVFGTKNTAQGASEAAELIEATEADVVLNAITGAAGLLSTYATLKTGKRLALANKESLIMGGKYFLDMTSFKGQITPVDSEHSAIAQAMKSGKFSEVNKLILTASGGPFYDRESLEGITLKDALDHPTWNMGPMISINSATMFNKGLEIIEAHLLFGIPYSQIDVVIHPQSIVHSMVEYKDGSVIAQASVADMTLPIGYALSWPNRALNAVRPLEWGARQRWDFLPPTEHSMRSINLARRAGEAGGVYPAVLNASNECAVEAFMAGKISFARIIHVTETVFNLYTKQHTNRESAKNPIEVILEEDARTRELAKTVIENMSAD